MTRAERLSRMSALEILQTLKCQAALAADMLKAGQAQVYDHPHRELEPGQSIGFVGDFEIRIRPDDQ